MSAQPEADWAISVVLPVYAGADPAQLRGALRSIYAQTLPAKEIIVVEDGPLTSRLRTILDEFGSEVPPLRREQLTHNRGVAEAVQAGVLAAQNPWIARMDADDIALPGRFAAQVDAVREGGYDLVGTAMLEFGEDDQTVLGTRRMPTTHSEIVRRLRISNAFNHPTVLFSRSLALSVGGYRPLSHLEDYDLFARMWAGGAKMHNLPEPLLRFRADDAMFRRRRQRGIHCAEFQLQRNLHDYGLISFPRMLSNFAARTAFRLLPTRLMRRAYRILFHEH